MKDAVLHRANGQTKVGNTLFPAFLSFAYTLLGFVTISILLADQAKAADKAQTVCETSPSQIGVRYQQRVHDLKTKTDSIHSMELWRNGSQVMHIYPEQGLAEQWDCPGKGALHLTVWFDRYKQGIEYMPEDIGDRADRRRWTEKWQLVPNSAIQTMKRETTSETGWKPTLKLVKDASGRQVTLIWNVPLQLPQQYTVKTNGSVETWEAREIVTDPQKVQKAFDRRTTYKTTDYIDIGDNESDPFLRKMINLGFVSHTSSGFYDSEGHAMQEVHGHYPH